MAKCGLAWVTSEKIRFIVYNLGYPANTYDEFGVAASPVAEGGQSTVPYGIAAWTYSSSTNNWFSFGVNISDMDLTAQTGEPYTLYAYAKRTDENGITRYWPIDSYMKFYVRDPSVDVTGITTTGITTSIKNLGCQLGKQLLPNGDYYLNEQRFGVMICDDYNAPTINSTSHNITGGTLNHVLSENSTGSYEKNISTKRDFVPGVQYTIWPVRMFELDISGSTVLAAYIIGSTEGISFTISDNPQIERWSWLDGGDKQAAYNALFALDKTILFKAKVWNAIVEKTRELYIAKNDYIYAPIGDNDDGFNPNYTHDDLMDIARMDDDKELTATRFNALRYCIGTYYSTKNYIDKQVKEPRDEVLADEVKALATCLNAAIDEYNNSL